MATKTFYQLNSKVSGLAFLALQDGGSAPATATASSGWTNGTVAITNFSKLAALVVRATTTFGSTALPASPLDGSLGDAFRTPAALTGAFASANWVATFPLVGSQTNGSIRLRLRLYRSTNADGTGATEITSAAQVGTTYTVTTTAGTSVVTFNPGAFTLTNEYLFVQVACETVTAGSTSTRSASLRVGSNGTIVTSDFAPPQTVAPLAATSTWVALAAAVALGGVTVTPSPATATWTAPASALAAVSTVAASPASASWAVPSAAVTSGNATRSPSPASTTWVILSPSVAVSGITAAPAPAVASWTALNPSIATAVTCTPPAASGAWSVLSPAVSVGGLIRAPASAASSWSALSPSVAVGGATVAPSPASALWTTLDPDVSAPAGPGIVTPGPATTTWSALSPAVSVGGIAATPGAASSVTTALDAAIAIGGVTHAPLAAVATWDALDATASVSGGPNTATPNAAMSRWTVLDPSISVSGIVAGPAPATRGAGVFSPLIEIGGVIAAPPSADASWQVLSPTVVVVAAGYERPHAMCATLWACSRSTAQPYACPRVAATLLAGPRVSAAIAINGILMANQLATVRINASNVVQLSGLTDALDTETPFSSISVTVRIIDKHGDELTPATELIAAPDPAVGVFVVTLTKTAAPFALDHVYRAQFSATMQDADSNDVDYYEELDLIGVAR